MALITPRIVSYRASKSLRSLCVLISAGTSVNNPFSASVSPFSLESKLQSVSTQWSTALIPVLSQIRSGVEVVNSGSRTTRLGFLVGGSKRTLALLPSSRVTPAMDWYSPPDKLVGIATWRITGSLRDLLFFPSESNLSMPSDVVRSLLSIQQITFAASVREPAPSVTIQSGLLGAASCT